MGSAELQAEAFKKYIEDKRILIADPSAVSRTSLAHVLTSLGAKTQHIALTPNYSMAEEEINRIKPRVVICDYDLGGKCGLDLLQRQRAQNPDSKDSLFVLVTANSSQSAVARAAEEDVDTYILKPFTADVIRSSLVRAALSKIDPTDYVKTIEKGKQLLAETKFDEALKVFEEARKLDSAPALACFYIGQTKLLKQAILDAEGKYNEGVEFNKIHYKCLVGLFEVLQAQKKSVQAYDIVKKISRYFPANPQRLTAVLRLAIVTKSYEDVEAYYRIFTTIDDRNEEIIKYICAALVVCGKYYLSTHRGSRAIELFQKAASTGSGRTRVLREIISTLVEGGLVKEADEFLKKFSPETQSSIDYVAMDLLLMDRISPRSQVVDRGRAILAKNLHDPLVYQILIRASTAAGLDAAAEDLIENATRRWPDSKDMFQKALQQGREIKAKPR